MSQVITEWSQKKNVLQYSQMKQGTETKPIVQPAGPDWVFRQGLCALNPNTKVIYMNLNI